VERRIAWIGFGEAAAAFAPGPGAGASRGYDRLTDEPATRAAKLADFARAGVVAADGPAAAVAGAGLVLSLVTADQALVAARAAAPHLDAGALWLDMNSVSPATKRSAAAAIVAGRGRYVDVAVMAPALPARRAVPLLVAGPDAEEAAAALRAIGFGQVATIAGGVGAASAVKMIRSVMVKGLEALSAECVLAAEAAGVRDAVIASLDASWPGADWAARFDYNLDRMLVHGRRRAAEMAEVAATLDALGTGAAMARATAERQRALGALAVALPPDGLDAKLALLAPAGDAARRDAA
jgi:3-hydroxyisobutyrate dehydrogenase-like beta-hydroxyacid dehydrogenase